MPLTLNTPPPTPVESVTETLHGVTITDPYRWLEDQNSTRTRKWLGEQTAYTRAYLDAIPDRDGIRKRVEELLAVQVISEPWKVGDRYFYLRRKPHQEQPVIVMREGDSGEEIVLVDPAERGDGSTTAVNILNISSDGNLLAYGVRQGGVDSQSAEFFNVNRKQVLPDRLPVGFGPALVFSPNGRGFYYSHEAINSARPHYRAVYWHEFGSTPKSDIEIFVAGEDPQLHLGVFGSKSGQLLAYVLNHAASSLTCDLYLHDLSGGNQARQILERIETIFAPFFIGNRLFALVDWKSPNLRIVAIDPERPEPDHWVDVVAESILRIKDFAVVNDSICVGYSDAVGSRIEVFDVTGQLRNTVPCPARGTARLLRRASESDTLFYGFSSFDHPPAIYCYEVQTGEQREWAKTLVTFDPSSFEIEQVTYKSKDGTLVPMFLVAAKGRGFSKPLRTFLTGYGGFGISLTPQFGAYSTFLIEQGFLLAVTNLRGGGEFGEEWHRAGKRHNRQNAIDDFIAGAEWLLENGYAAPGKIAIGGGSNGGLLVAAALTQRPDLFRAVVCVGPLLDMLRYHLFDFANMWVDEYGTSEMEDDFPHILAYSPYHGVKERISYPAVFIVSGDADTRCNPMHARKMTARLQAATSSGRPILLEYNPSWGHTPLQSLTRRIEALTDRLAFVCHELEVSV